MAQTHGRLLRFKLIQLEVEGLVKCFWPARPQELAINATGVTVDGQPRISPMD